MALQFITLSCASIDMDIIVANINNRLIYQGAPLLYPSTYEKLVFPHLLHFIALLLYIT